MKGILVGVLPLAGMLASGVYFTSRCEGAAQRAEHASTQSHQSLAQTVELAKTITDATNTNAKALEETVKLSQVIKSVSTEVRASAVAAAEHAGKASASARAAAAADAHAQTSATRAEGFSGSARASAAKAEDSNANAVAALGQFQRQVQATLDRAITGR